MLISSCWQLSSEVELRHIFDVCKRWANSGSHEFVKKNMVRYMRPHGRFAHCSCKNAVRQPPVLASCIEIYYCRILTISSIDFWVLVILLNFWYRLLKLYSCDVLVSTTNRISLSVRKQKECKLIIIRFLAFILV